LPRCPDEQLGFGKVSLSSSFFLPLSLFTQTQKHLGLNTYPSFLFCSLLKGYFRPHA
jgi:hypothetical protein